MVAEFDVTGFTTNGRRLYCWPQHGQSTNPLMRKPSKLKELRNSYRTLYLREAVRN